MVQTTIVMDDVAEGQYETIYFCGVLKAGYLHKNPFQKWENGETWNIAI